jgi:hypothetical protein
MYFGLFGYLAYLLSRLLTAMGSLVAWPFDPMARVESPFWMTIALVVWVLIARGLLLGIAAWLQPHPLQALAQWSNTIWGLQERPELFYRRVSELLQVRLQEVGAQIVLENADAPSTAASSTPPTALHGIRLNWHRLLSYRSHFFFARQPYLQVRYRHLTYYLYASPLPGGFFVSTWLFSKHTNAQNNPLKMGLLLWRLNRMTLFEADAIEMFHLALQRAVFDVVDDYCRELALPPLDDLARRPVLHGFYARTKGASQSLGAYVTPAPMATSPVVAPSAVNTTLPFEAPLPPHPAIPPTPASPATPQNNDSGPGTIPRDKTPSPYVPVRPKRMTL